MFNFVYNPTLFNLYRTILLITLNLLPPINKSNLIFRLVICFHFQNTLIRKIKGTTIKRYFMITLVSSLLMLYANFHERRLVGNSMSPFSCSPMGLTFVTKNMQIFQSIFLVHGWIGAHRGDLKPNFKDCTCSWEIVFFL